MDIQCRSSAVLPISDRCIHAAQSENRTSSTDWRTGITAGKSEIGGPTYNTSQIKAIT